MRALVAVLGLVLVTSLFVAVPPATAAATTPPIALPATPRGLKPPVTLPTTLDPAARYQPQVACVPTALPGLLKLRDLVLATYGQGGAGNTVRTCTEGTSEHADGRAWDWMINPGSSAQKAAAADFLSWLTANRGANARRLGVMYVIYNEKIWAIYREAEGWRPSSGHRDHIHVSLSWNGARGNVSFWTGAVHPVDHGPCVVFAGQPGVPVGAPRTTPCPAATALLRTTSQKTLMYGAKSASVSVAQKALRITATGVLDKPTRTALNTYQKAHDLPVTAALDQPTWASLVPSTRVTDAVAGLTSAQALQRGLDSYAGSRFGRGTVGLRVLVLQVALGLRPADRNGWFGPVTETAVSLLQTAAGLPVTGVVDARTWAAIDPA